MNVFFVLNYLLYGLLNNNIYIRLKTRKYLLIDRDIFDNYNDNDNDNDRNFPIVKKKKRIFLFKTNAKNKPQPWDGYDCRDGWNPPEENITIISIDELEKQYKIGENTCKMNMLKKLQSNTISSLEKINLIKTNPEAFEKSTIQKGSLFRGLEDFEFTEFYIQDI